MKLFLASANLDEIRWAIRNGLVDGVFTTPAMLADAAPGVEPREHLAAICEVAPLPVAASVGAINETDIYRHGRELARFSDQIIIKVPVVEDSLIGIRRLSGEGARIAATLVFNGAQAIMAARLGASLVVVHVDELDAHGHDGVDVVREVHAVLDACGTECEVLAALPRHAAQFTACALAGADAIAIDAPVLRSLLVHPLTDRGIDQLLTDLSRRPKPRSVP
jgi:transaldolase